MPSASNANEPANGPRRGKLSLQHRGSSVPGLLRRRGRVQHRPRQPRSERGDRESARAGRGLLGRSRRSPIRGHNSSVSRHGLLGVGSLKQLPKPVCQQSDGLPQGAELPNPDYRDGSVQVKRWGTQYFHGIDRMIPGNKASG